MISLARKTSLTTFTRRPKILILGTGLAGLSAALKIIKNAPDIEITVVSKSELEEGATKYAQGGIASVWSKEDSFENHKKDTLLAGAGLCHPNVVEVCVREGPQRVQELIELGVQFTKVKATGQILPDYDLHREGGHGQRRILHAADMTGLEIEKTLIEELRKNPSVKILEYHIAIDLLTEAKLKRRGGKPGRCLGAYVLDEKSSQIITLGADITILATGGAGKVYLYTSNPDTATGDGIAMAYRAGAHVANLEFMQFHPTCLYHPGARTFLISEAVRGEGAVLRTVAGEEFMGKHHAMASLAPRDIVARAIDIEMKRTGDKYVLLDCAKIGDEKITKKFPNIYQTCMKFGFDMTKEPIPVVPAAHYTCGGVLVDENAQTSIQGLFAVGEVACTGLHGANRLASNSLLEAVVFAHRAVTHALHKVRTASSRTELPATLPAWNSGQAVALEEQIDIAASWLELRTLMWNYVGIVRSNRRLERAKRRLDLIKSEVNSYYWNYLLTKDLIELRNLITVADLIVGCAQLRKESRGLHYTVDYPNTDDAFYKNDTIL